MYDIEYNIVFDAKGKRYISNEKYIYEKLDGIMGKYNRILFLGFRCAGKTTISKKLSKMMNMSLIDIDEEIEKEQGKNKPLCSLYQVRDMYYKAKCYKQMGDLEKAKSCFDYVIDNGGDLMYKQFAIELYEQMKNDKNNC